MARQKKNRDVSIVHFSFFDLLFGAFGAFVFLMIMQVISTLNLVDVDLQKVIDETIKEKQSLRQKLASFKDTDQKLNILKSQYKQAMAERERLIKSQDKVNQRNQELNAELSRLNREISELDKLKSELKEKDAIQKNLETKIGSLKKESQQLDIKGKQLAKQLASHKKQPLKIMTSAFPTTFSGEKLNFALSAVGGTPPYTWSLEGELPRGLSFNPLQGTISGVANDTGRFQFKVQIKDAADEKATFRDPLLMNLVKKPKEEKSTVSPWFVVMTVISILLLAYILWGKHKARQHYKKMIAEGWKLQWIK